MTDYTLKLQPEMLPQDIRDLFTKYSISSSETPIMFCLGGHGGFPEAVDLIALEEELEKVYKSHGVTSHPEINILFDDWCCHWQGVIKFREEFEEVIRDAVSAYKVSKQDLIDLVELYFSKEE